MAKRCSFLLKGMNVSKSYWHMAVLMATYLINRIPRRVLNGKTLFQILMPADPISHKRKGENNKDWVFGSTLVEKKILQSMREESSMLHSLQFAWVRGTGTWYATPPNSWYGGDGLSWFAVLGRGLL